MVKQERAARTRSSLIQAAAEVFAEAGFVSASLATISKRAGVSNGALHFHFSNKTTLADAVETEAAEAVRRLTEAARARQGDSLQSVVDAMHELTHALARDAVVRAGFELSSDIARRPTSPLRKEWQRWVEESLRRAALGGALAQGVSWADAARVVVAVTVGLEVLGGKDASWLSPQSVTGFWELLLPRLSGGREPDTLARSGSRRPAGVPPQTQPQLPAPER